MHPTDVYDAIGGEATMRALVDHFYAHVETDPILRPLFPEDMEPGKRHQLLFLTQYFGGPMTYNDERGHPRLRMRHMPFAIGPAERDAWLGHMLNAVDAVGIAEPARSVLRVYFENAAAAMMNRA